MHRFAVLSLLALCLGLQVRAAALLGEVITLSEGKSVSGASIFVSPRIITAGHLLPLERSGPEIEFTSDANGQFVAEAPEGFIVIRVQKGGFAEYLNTLVKVEPGKKNFIRVELTSAEPTAVEAELIEQKREMSRLAQQFSQADEKAAFEEPKLAAADPVVPTEVAVVNLNGFTGSMNLDEFISGVISAEMGDGFPYEALKAQAIAARTFALTRLRDRGQANGGQAYTSTLGSRCRAAASNSSAVALTYNNSYITAFFSARCNGDFTLDSEDGLSGLSTCTVGGLTGRFIAYLRKVPCSGHVNCSQTSEQCCDVTVDGRSQHIYGHGVGLCQRGAQQFAARDGFNFQQIVDRFYTSVKTLTGNQARLGDRVELLTTANRRTVPCGGISTSTALGSKGVLIAGPETMPCTLISGTSWITWWRIAFDNGARGWVAEDFFKKAPAVQIAPDVLLNITSLGDTVQVAATGLANVRVVLEDSSNAAAWNAVATNTFSTGGATTFTRPSNNAERFYRARLALPDTAP